ncbi:MAG TPA: ABC transporter substrate-binding protein [Phycisphaerae bacterium]|nr:ABC transporter substrate-binding protein [Phycisphaerae bacterium]HOJ74488.1 ABC transporter substrate-binding protein [Phycisphaerae bacterium]HOM53315.1 ABC transporter substrate-binding protein [Phycisphaerae bacterium]HOQ87506.1 ABC transporter substrate-binding protein [Phycisphaerae bacterium]HPP28555.1 ABC transporter substrate-binding protein [Phycisphaerae bacterium]
MSCLAASFITFNRRRVGGRLAASVALLALALLAGCVRSEPDDGKLHLTYWEKWERFEREAMQRVVDDFNASQDRIVVHMHTFGSIDKKILGATAGGNPPDVAGVWMPYIVPFAERGVLTPLNPYLERDGIKPDHWIKVYADMCTYKGTMWAVPTTPSATALYWNKAMFRAAGLDPDRPPRTIAELDEMAEKLTRYDADGRIIQMGFLPTEPDWFLPAYGAWWGGEPFDGQNITANTPGHVEALDWIRSYSLKYGVDRLKRFASGFGNFSSPQNPFFSGKLAMVLHGVWLHSYISQYAPGMDYGAAPWPKTPRGPENFTLADADVLIIPAGLPQHRRDAAWEFVKFVSSQRGMETLNLGQRKNTPLAEVSEGFLENHPHRYIRLFIDLSKGPGVWHYPQMGIWSRYDNEIRAAVEKMRYLEINPETGQPYTGKEALDMVQTRISAGWARYQKSLALRAARQEAAP